MVRLILLSPPQPLMEDPVPLITGANLAYNDSWALATRGPDHRLNQQDSGERTPDPDHGDEDPTNNVGLHLGLDLGMTSTTWECRVIS